MCDIFILSLIQGLTEFLPVSSSGHLILLPSLLGMQEHNIAVDGILHFGTLCAILIYFRQDILLMIQAFFNALLKRKNEGEDEENQQFYFRLSLAIILGTIPVVIVGFALKRLGVDMVRTPVVIGGMSILGGILLFASDWMGRQDKTLLNLRYGHSIFIGFFQILSLFPGGSRSGMCLVAARSLGFERVSAVTFAFLLAIPAVGGAFVLIAFDAIREGFSMPLMEIVQYFSYSFLIGLGTIHLMLKFVSRFSLAPFGLYRIALGAFILWWF